MLCMSVIAGASSANNPNPKENEKESEKKNPSHQTQHEGKDSGPGSTTVKKLTFKILPNKKSVRLDWEAPEEEGEIIVARSYSIIDSMDKLQIADSLGKYPSNKKNGITSFTDYNLRSGKYYYAVVMAEDVRKGVVFHADQNYTSKPTIISRPVDNNDNVDHEPEGEVAKKADKSSHFIKSLHVTKEKQFLRIRWDPPANADDISPMYTIYRSSEELSSLPLLKKAEKLVEVNHPDTTFLDQDLNKSQTFFYGVSVTVHEKESLPLTKNKSYVRIFYVKDNDNTTPADNNVPEKSDEPPEEDKKGEEPVKKVEPEKKEVKPTGNTDDLYEILRNTYWVKRYDEAVYRLREFAQKENDSFYRGKAFLYIGLSYYRLRNYREAMQYMLKEEARLYNEERTDFYIKRCLEILGDRK